MMKMSAWLIIKFEIIASIILYSLCLTSSELNGENLLRLWGRKIFGTDNTYKNYREFCDQSFESIQYNKDEKCSETFKCHKNKCVCPAGHGYDIEPDLMNSSNGKCIDFNEYVCLKSSECQDIDNNRFCNSITNRCECNEGFYEENDQICAVDKYLLNQNCLIDRDCQLEYTYCKNNICQCWPEFEPYNRFDYNKNKSFCARKICSNSFNCQTTDNPNLICNNTICECEYGYSMNNKKICVKTLRRHNCNLTCQIIGGLFASIFMLSLVYWFFYCCYSIVRNYKLKNETINTISCDHRIGSPAQLQRLTNSDNSPGIVGRRNQYLQSSSHITPDYRHSFYYESQNPPNYSELLDLPPDYETVVNIKNNQ